MLATKASAHLAGGEVPAGDALVRHLKSQLETSLQMLQTDFVDVWQIHLVDAQVLAARDAVIQAFDETRQEGKVRAAGGSFYGDLLPRQALEQGGFETMQVTYSVFDQRLADHVLPQAAARQIGVLARSILLKGALTERAEFLPDKLEPLRQRARRYRRVVAEAAPQLTPAQAAVGFALACPQISSALIGVRDEEELRQSLVAVEKPLDEGLQQRLIELRIDDARLLDPSTWDKD